MGVWKEGTKGFCFKSKKAALFCFGAFREGFDSRNWLLKKLKGSEFSDDAKTWDLKTQNAFQRPAREGEFDEFFFTRFEVYLLGNFLMQDV